MANIYSSYTKVIENKTYYFVKIHQAFPELKGIPPFLVNYGMHSDFDKACSIASITDPKIKEQLLNELNSNIPQAKVIELGSLNFSENKMAR
jgi:hypothetical protein